MISKLIVTLSFLFIGNFARAHAESCSEMYIWDSTRGMCMPLSMPGMPMKMFMFHYNTYLVQTFEEGPRGRNAFSAPNEFMFDIGSSIGDKHYLNFEVMATAEKWTLPKDGYPELLQIGEANEDEKPYIDSQHPHSSPIAGLTLSDTYTIKDKSYFKLAFSPRGAATEGPIEFSHRPSGSLNPDAPLGHHIGQDVGHISSTVLAASLRLNKTIYEASIFNGTEPEPAKVDLPIGEFNSYAARIIHEFSAHTMVMGSLAYVKEPEHDDPSLDHVWRYSASLYRERTLDSGWRIHNSFIWGLINNYDHTSSLNSFSKEFLFAKENKNWWGRFEALQRAPEQLLIMNVPGNNDPHWVFALTLGYTHKLVRGSFGDLGLGASVTKDFLPEVYQPAYGGNPLTAKIFLQASGMNMWDF